MKIAGRNRIFPPLSIIYAANKKTPVTSGTSGLPEFTPNTSRQFTWIAPVALVSGVFYPSFPLTPSSFRACNSDRL